MTILVGSDPEVFVVKDGQVVSAIGLIGRGKDNPLVVEGGALLEDNVLAEFNIPPASSSDQFVSSIKKMLSTLCTVTGGDYVAKPSHVFTREYLKAQPDIAMEFGCDIDYNAYTGEANPKPNPWTTLRTAGGHVHVGASGIEVRRLVKVMDLYLGVPSVLLDEDNQRRQLYGNAGAYRPKEYGLEYRTLSNFWLQSDELMKWVYDTTIKAVQDHKTVDLPDENTIIECIDNSNKSLAQELCDGYRLSY